MNGSPPLPKTWAGFTLWLLALFVLSQALTWCASAASVKLAWNANPEEDIAGYRVSYGTDDFSQEHPVGNVTATTIEGLQPGVTYQFVLRAVNEAGLESEPTAPISHTVPAGIMPPPPLDMTGSTIHSFSSEETAGENAPAVHAIDGEAGTFWHSRWANEAAMPPHYIAVTLPRRALGSALYYLPRQDGETNGHILRYEVQSSLDGETWEAWSDGEWHDDASEKIALLPMREVRHFRLWGNEDFAAAASLKLGGTYVPDAMVPITFQESSDLQAWSSLLEIERPPGRRFFRIGVGDQFHTYEIKPVSP